ncbi:Alpha/Beta hydrolase protein [Lasiosphaeria ovina]|uniref:Alpha/Beta hydrolase protein n=1 Tax=Lasiosphaeria ovina TaxID=92902 RepID=A0AAE0JTA3_9PEZI|nr:Alpha/Beta hydrolase protein [Lasiosphaeria ovina]
MPRLPLLDRVKFAVLAVVMQLGVRVLQRLMRAVLGFVSPAARATRPTLVKRYAVRKGLPVRIFIPASPSPPTVADTRLPVLLTIHGGGFVMGAPADDDAWNRAFADEHGVVVVALNYSKAPWSAFPAPVHDVAALVGCVLSDSSLPIDGARAALAGFSAGGNLALSAAALPGVRARVKAVVPVYPCADWVPRAAVKATTRRYKAALGGFRGRAGDYLLPAVGVFQWAYLRAGQPLADGVLSPARGPRDALPGSVFVVACELDMLAGEAWRLACGLAGRAVPAVKAKVGQEAVTAGHGELILDDERFAFEDVVEQGGGVGRYRWLLVPDVVHGFDHEDTKFLVRDEVAMDDARIKTAKVRTMIGRWLLDGPLAGNA